MILLHFGALCRFIFTVFLEEQCWYVKLCSDCEADGSEQSFDLAVNGYETDLDGCKASCSATPGCFGIDHKYTDLDRCYHSMEEITSTNSYSGYNAYRKVCGGNLSNLGRDHVTYFLLWL